MGVPILIAAVAGAMAWWSWGKWPDVFVDFGRELYIAWQISEGKALYRDIAYYNGPLSPYLNGLWFACFGVGLRTLVICNLAILGLMTWMLHHLLRQISDRIAAAAACLVFVTVFAFNQYVPCGNYNYVCPYSHDAVHGLALALASLCSVTAYGKTGSKRYLMLAGLLLGLVFLTRSEVFVAAAISVGSGMALSLWRRQPRVPIARHASLFVGCTLIAPLACFVLLCISLSASQALQGTLGSWPALLSGRLTEMQFFKFSMGLTDFGGNARSLLTWTGWTIAALAPAFVLAWLIPGQGRTAISATVSIAVPYFAVAALFCNGKWVIELARPLPLWLAMACIVAMRRLLQKNAEWTIQRRAIGVIGLGMLSLALLGKILLFARVYHYGFYHAMTAFLLMVALFVGWIPQWLSARGKCGTVFRGAALALLAAVILGHLVKTADWFDCKTARVGVGADAFWADPMRGEGANLMLEQISQRVSPNETIVAVPEGVMLNYLSRRRNPTPLTNFMPTEMTIFGETPILDALRAHPPDWVVMVHKDTSEFGYRFFGHDYAASIGSWIEENYRLVAGIGNPPLVDEKFGLVLMRRIER